MGTLQAENKNSGTTTKPCRWQPRTLGDISRLPKSLKVLLETSYAGRMVIPSPLKISGALAGWLKHAHDREIALSTGKGLMQDFTGVPGWEVDLRQCAKR